MIKLVEFLSSEPMENILSAKNNKAQRVIFFSSNKDIIDEYFEHTKKCILKYTDAKEVVCHYLPDMDFQGIKNSIQEILKSEYNKDDSIFIDIVGGDSLALVAFGTIVSEYSALTSVDNAAMIVNPYISNVDGAYLSIEAHLDTRKIILEGKTAPEELDASSLFFKVYNDVKDELDECICEPIFNWDYYSESLIEDIDSLITHNKQSIFGIKGYVPYYVACTSKINTGVLFTFATYAKKLGGHSTKILIYTDNDSISKSVQNRAREMGIDIKNLYH